MFRALLFSLDPQASAESTHPLEKMARDSRQLSLCRVIQTRLSPYEISLLVNSYDPDVLLLDVSDWDSAAEMAAHIRANYPRIAMIGFGAGWADEVRTRCQQIGVYELLVSPATVRDLQEAVRHAIHRNNPDNLENLYSFIPAKAGSGCTTITFNIAGCLAGELKKKLVVVEADLHSGVLSFILNARNRGTVIDALENSDRLDYSMWQNCIIKRGEVDFLISDRARPLPLWSDYYHLLEFIRKRYEMILVDFPEVVNEASIEIVMRSKYVFVVCTPEMPSLRLAQRRCQALTEAGIPSGRIGIIVNRWHESDITEAEIENLLGYGVAGVFPNDYGSVSKAVYDQGTYVDQSTLLGKSFLSFSKLLAGIPDDYEPQGRKSRFGFLKGVKIVWPNR